MLHFLAVGIGQCGNKFADAFAKNNMKAIAINTTDKDMSRLSYIDKQNLINISINNNAGAGKTPAIGQISMQKHLEMVCNHIDLAGKDANYILLWAGLGGGTGSGALPVLFKELKRREKNVIIGMTLPDETEGFEVKANAIKACIEILKLAETFGTPFFIIDNNKIRDSLKMESDTDKTTANDKIARIITQFNRYANQPSSYSTFDETDYKKTLSASGMVAISKTLLAPNTLHTVDILPNKVLSDWEGSPHFVDYDKTTARMLTVIINVPEKWAKARQNIKLVEAGIERLKESCGTVSLYTGIYTYKDNTVNGDGNIAVYCMLTGLKAPMDRLMKLQSDAKRETEAIRDKERSNKIDFSAFDVESLDVAPETPKDDPFASFETSKEDEDATLEVLRKQGLL